MYVVQDIIINICIIICIIIIIIICIIIINICIIIIINIYIITSGTYERHTVHTGGT